MNTENISSVRVVYLFLAFILTFSWLVQSWGLVLFVCAMLCFAVLTKFCPSKWFFEKIGFKKTDI